ncbi:MAG: DUF1349 domain-containing protein [Prolixibacteraceae bacterium]|nr:DUF1349 domain-containing protein [Prolixibacteraceae bacterium]
MITNELNEYYWLNQPQNFQLEAGRLLMETDPGTDYWQRTYYGFRNDNAHTFIREVEGDFSFTVKTEFETKMQYDQCGIILYQDSENWMKASVEYENTDFARLGSVVTNLGFSDWATADVPASTNEVWYRLSRRKQDFYLESSPDGMQYQQMRMFHIYNYITVARVGVYACSPLESSFKARFSAFELSECRWPDHLTKID